MTTVTNAPAGPARSSASWTSRLKGALPWSVTESGWSYNGPFSTYKELHAAILGLAAGFLAIPELQGGVVAFALGRGTKGSSADAHWRQVAEEPAYALGAMTVGRALRRPALTGTVLEFIGGLL